MFLVDLLPAALWHPFQWAPQFYLVHPESECHLIHLKARRQELTQRISIKIVKNHVISEINIIKD